MEAIGIWSIGSDANVTIKWTINHEKKCVSSLTAIVAYAINIKRTWSCPLNYLMGAINFAFVKDALIHYEASLLTALKTGFWALTLIVDPLLVSWCIWKFTGKTECLKCSIICRDVLQSVSPSCPLISNTLTRLTNHRLRITTDPEPLMESFCLRSQKGGVLGMYVCFRVLI